MLVLPTLTACGGGDKPASIKVGYLADVTGPYAAVGAPLVKGFSDHFEMINQNGGIEGVPVEVLWEDTGAKADLAVTAYKRMKNEGIVAVSCMVTPVALAVQSLLNEDKIPGINQSATLSLYDPPQDYMWCHGPIAVDGDLAGLYWFDTELWPSSGGQWTLGILAHDNPFALGGVSAMYKYADTNNVKLLQPEVVALGTQDYTANIKRLVDAGADLIVLETLGASTGTVLKQMGDLGVLGTPAEAAAGDGKVVPFLGQTSFYPEQLTAAKAEAAYVYGAIPFYLDYETDNPGVKIVNDFMVQKYGEVIPPAEGGGGYRDGWNNAFVMSSALTRAVKEVGWDALTGETLMEYGLKGLRIDKDTFAQEISYDDYDGDRIAVQAYRPGAWDMTVWDRKAIGPWLNIPEMMPELRVTSYMTTQAGTGWYKP